MNPEQLEGIHSRLGELAKMIAKMSRRVDGRLEEIEKCLYDICDVMFESESEDEDAPETPGKDAEEE